jgi:hypothetical protein
MIAMSRQPLSRERICDALESCRPGSNDLDAPDLADIAAQVAQNPHWEEVYERIQNIDLKISAAFQDVEIPAGLEQRLLASLKIAEAEDEFSAALKGATAGDADIGPTAESVAASAIDSKSKKNRKLSRRWLLASGGLLAAATILIAIFLGIDNSGGYSKRTALEEAIQFFDADNSATPGQLLVQVSAPRQFPLSVNVRFSDKIRWRMVKNFMGKAGVAFDLPTPRGVRATLYAVDRTIPDLPASPANPANSGGCYVAAWQEDGLVYVLVVRGSQQNYDQYLHPRGPMA